MKLLMKKSPTLFNMAQRVHYHYIDKMYLFESHLFEVSSSEKSIQC